MPIYEYECIPNKHRFEVIQKFSDPPVSHCTVCGESVQRLLSAPAFHFKGSGWYITDYARKSNAPASDASKDKDKSEAASKETAPSTDTSTKTTTDTSTSTPKTESKE